jgi:hypothetical protein
MNLELKNELSSQQEGSNNFLCADVTGTLFYRGFQKPFPHFLSSHFSKAMSPQLTFKGAH